MNHYLRVMKLAMRYRWTLAGTLLSSLCVAVFWGGNIGALFPVFEVVFKGHSLQTWVRDEISVAERALTKIDEELAEPPGRTDVANSENQTTTANAKLALETRRLAARARLTKLQWLEPLIERYLPNQPFQTIVAVMAALMVATLLKEIGIVANMMLVARLVQKVVVDLQRQLFDHVLRSDQVMFGTRGTSGLMSHMNNDISTIGGGLNQLFGGAIREPLKMLACFALAAFISWRLLFFSMLLAPVAAILIKFLAGSLKRANRRGLEQLSRLNHLCFETFNGLQTVQAYTMEETEQKRFHANSGSYFRKAMRIVFYGALTKPVTEILGLGVVCSSFLAGAYLVLNQQTHLLGVKISDWPLDISSLLVFYGALVGISDPARRLSEIFNNIQAGVAACERLFSVLDEKSQIADPVSARELPVRHRQIVWDNVSFHYQAGQPVLQNVSLTVRSGEVLAIVGSNGCGKSTLINLLPRFFDAVSGTVCLDDINVRDVRLHDLRKRIGYVTQQTQIFDDTVLNNIRYGSPDATEEQVIAAAREAHAHQFITEKLENGYQSLLGQNGSRLSGGQRQRIALARAILRDPEILILDEATSQVDIESEQLIHDTLQHFTHGRTALIVTHRLSTLALANRVLVMDAGRIIDIGTHDELIRRCDLYRRLHDIQFRQQAA